MNHPYYTQLVDTVEKKFLKAKIQRDLDAVRDEITDESVRVNKLREKLIKEKADVKALTQMSVTNLVQTILGNKAEKLEKEQAEQITAEIKYQTAAHLLEIMQSEEQGLLKQLNTLQDVDHKIEKLLAAKPKRLNSEQITLAEKIARIHVNQTEIDEAIEAGEIAENNLKNTLDFLNSARRLGIFDLVGGGLLASSAKHTSLDDAQRYAKKAQINLQKFNRELHDVDQTNITISLHSDLVRIADILFDGLFLDLLVQRRINESIEKIKKTETTLKNKIKSLKSLRDIEIEEAQQLEQKWQALSEID